MIKVSNVDAPQKKDMRAINWMIRKIDVNAEVYYAGQRVTYGEILRKKEYVEDLIRSRSSAETINRNIKSLLDITAQMLPSKLYNEYIQLHGLSNGYYNGYTPKKSFQQLIISFITTGLVSFGGAFALGMVFHLPLIVVIIIGCIAVYFLGKMLF